MNIAHLLRDSFRDKSKVKFLGDLTDINTLFVGLTEIFLNSNNLDLDLICVTSDNHDATMGFKLFLSNQIKQWRHKDMGYIEP